MQCPPPFEGALRTRGWAQSCADIDLFVCANDYYDFRHSAAIKNLFLLLFLCVLVANIL